MKKEKRNPRGQEVLREMTELDHPQTIQHIQSKNAGTFLYWFIFTSAGQMTEKLSLVTNG